MFPGRRPTPSGNRTCSLLVYGSLMHPDERLRAGFGHTRGMPVILTDFVRDFSHRPSWRSGRGSARGVLRVQGSAEQRVNAVLVPRVPLSLLAKLDRRERGYLRRPVALRRITSFADGAPAVPEGETTFVYEGRRELHAPDLSPDPEYLSLCLAAARQWGARFERMFLETTLIGRHAMNAVSWRSGHLSCPDADAAAGDITGSPQAGLRHPDRADD